MCVVELILDLSNYPVKHENQHGNLSASIVSCLHGDFPAHCCKHDAPPLGWCRHVARVRQPRVRQPPHSAEPLPTCGLLAHARPRLQAASLPSAHA